MVQLGSPWRLNTIYRTNMQSSMMAGRWQRFYENRRNRPYLQYIAVMDAATRHSHAELHGKIFHIDDPIWNTIYPPNGFNCRCRVRALTAAQAKQRGFNPKSKYQPTDDFPDKGFNHNSGIGQVANDIKAWKSWHKLDRLKNKRFVTEQIRTHVDKLVQLNYYANFVDKVFHRGRSIGELLVVGYLGQNEFNFIKSVSPNIDNGALVLRDGLLVGPKAKRHSRTQARRKKTTANALSQTDWKLLPFYLVRQKAVYWDKMGDSMIVIFKSLKDPRWIKLVYRYGEFKKEGIIGVTVRTAFYIDQIDIYTADKNRFVLIEGGL